MSQSLAGRVGQFELLPLSQSELAQCAEPQETLEETLFRGGYPEVHGESLDCEQWYNAYIGT